MSGEREVPDAVSYAIGHRIRVEILSALHELSDVSDEEWTEMSEEERQEITRWALQSLMAEALAAFWAGKITSDPRQVRLLGLVQRRPPGAGRRCC